MDHRALNNALLPHLDRTLEYEQTQLKQSKLQEKEIAAMIVAGPSQPQNYDHLLNTSEKPGE